jgi:UDP-N-acetylglucosamine 2-epimerase (non-hydrolysing)
MEKIKIMSIFGTRPEAIKFAPVISELSKEERIDLKILITAQHREMLDEILKFFNIKPDYDLNIMKENQTLSEITANVLLKLDRILKLERPELVLVQGDTNTTFSASLCSYYNKIKVAHIEAGLRSYNKYHPYPEEINRILVDQISDICFAPTSSAKKNLLKMGIEEEKIFVVGNTVIDALKTIIKRNFEFPDNLKKILNRKKKIILATAHRRESWEEEKFFIEICESLKLISSHYQDVIIIFSLHKNPKIRKIAYEILKNEERVYLFEPFDYITFANLMKRCYFIITDSGGIQEEAPTLGKPTLVTRETTERREGVKEKIVKIVGRNRRKIFEESKKLLENKKIYEKRCKIIKSYGDGKAAKRIKNIILNYFNFKKVNVEEFRC